MSRKADFGRDDEGNRIRLANLNDLDATVTIGIDAYLSLAQEVADGAVVMGTSERGGVGVGTARRVDETRLNVPEPRQRV
jgi:hypothetical protein